MNKKLLLLLLLAILFAVTSCTVQHSSIHETLDSTIKGTTPNIPDKIESTTFENIESTVTNITDEPEVLFEVLPEIPFPTGYSWLKRELEKYTAFPELRDLTPIHQKDKAIIFSSPFSPPHNNLTHFDLDDVQKREIPIEHITVTDSDHACAIFKIEHATTGEYAYFYQIYKQRVYDKKTNIEYRMYEKYLRTNESYWGTNGLKYSDFSELKSGDSLEKLKTLVPHIGWELGSAYGSINTANYLLLEDGVLYIELGNIDYSDYFMEEIQFYPNGTDAEINGQPLSILKATNRPPLPGEDD